MKISSFVMIIVSAIFAVPEAYAVKLTPEQALARALDGPLRSPGPSSSCTLAHTAEVEGCPEAYVFTLASNPGFIVVSADDRSVPLWGYGDSALTDCEGNMAPAFEYWLDWISHRASLDKSPYKMSDGSPRPFREPIEPMCKTQWSQEWPFNNKCPNLYGQLCVTGCGATSVAQVMKYHNWPPMGEGSTSYTWNNRTLSMDFSETSFDWENMLDSYSFGASSEQQGAVALLMKAVGYAVHMDYNPVASGAQPINLGPALVDNFRYDKCARFVDRSWFSFYDWEELIYDSLRDFGPVVYNGQSSAGGHSFVCDGYASDGYFHINWGWRGVSNGYFILDALDPESQGTGGSGNNSGFDFYQSAVIDITPDRIEGSQPFCQLAWTGALNLTPDKNEKKITVATKIYNSGTTSIPSGTFGLSFTPISKSDLPQGERILYGLDFGGSDADIQLPSGELKVGEGFADISFDVAGLETGRYLLKPFFAGPGESPRDIAHSLRYSDSWIATVGEKRIRLQQLEVAPVCLHDLEFGNSFSDVDPITVCGLAVNNLEYSVSMDVKAVVLDDELSEILATTRLAEVSLGGNVYGAFEFAEMPSDCTALEKDREYQVSMAMGDGAGGVILLSEPVSMLFTGISGVENAATGFRDAREFFNAQGIRVAEVRPGDPDPTLPHGIYLIRTQSGKTTKLLK